MLHALAGEPFMGEPAAIRTNIPGAPPGETELASSGWGFFWAAIAPYSFPILAIPPLILKLLPFGQTPPASLVIDILLGPRLWVSIITASGAISACNRLISPLSANSWASPLP